MQTTLAGGGAPADAPTAAAVVSPDRRPWPQGLPDQIKAAADILATAGRPLTQAGLEAHFAARGRWRDRLPISLETLETVGRARQVADWAEWMTA